MVHPNNSIKKNSCDLRTKKCEVTCEQAAPVRQRLLSQREICSNLQRVCENIRGLSRLRLPGTWSWTCCSLRLWGIRR